MNTVAVKDNQPKPTYEAGSIWKDPDDGNMFILSTVDYDRGTLFCAVSLKDGNRWDTPNKDVSVAVKKLQFVAASCEITINPK